MRYRVQVVVGDYWLNGAVSVDADTPEDAKAEAEEKVRAATIEAVQVWEAED
jgi:hypothetical protein